MQTHLITILLMKYSKAFKQPPLPGIQIDSRVINVASVPQLSPFRYPGGKTWLVPHIFQWLSNLKSKPHLFLEPFAGGGIVSLTIASLDLADKVLMVEIDDQVAAVWKTILSEDNEWLARKILSFDLTTENTRKEIDSSTDSVRQKAFRTILRNRVLHGGILAPGSSLIKKGENGKGLKSRWYPETLARRIRNIAGFSRRISFIEGDGIKVIQEHLKDDNTIFFIDPPYTAGGKRAGSRLYTYHNLDHQNLFGLCADLRGDFLMTYDHSQEVIELARKHNLNLKTVAMKNAHHKRMNELLIGRALGWL